MSVREWKADDEVEEVMSNFDHEIRPGADEELREGKWGRHSAWEFNGRVWYEDGAFHEEVWRYGVPREVLSAPTLDALMRAVNDEWGWE